MYAICLKLTVLEGKTTYLWQQKLKIESTSLKRNSKPYKNEAKGFSIFGGNLSGPYLQDYSVFLLPELWADETDDGQAERGVQDCSPLQQNQ
jgi:hypothetical protein